MSNKEVKVRVCSHNDKRRVTIDTNQLSKRYKFRNGDSFYVEFNNDFVVKMTVSRDGATLYCKGSIGYIPMTVQMPTIGNKVSWTITNMVRS